MIGWFGGWLTGTGSTSEVEDRIRMAWRFRICLDRAHEVCSMPGMYLLDTLLWLYPRACGRHRKCFHIYCNRGKLSVCFYILLSLTSLYDWEPLWQWLSERKSLSAVKVGSLGQSHLEPTYPNESGMDRNIALNQTADKIQLCHHSWWVWHPGFVNKEAGAGISCRIMFLYIPGVPVAFGYHWSISKRNVINEALA